MTNLTGENRMTRTPAPARDRYWLCGDDCTTDCGICKGAGRTPAPALTAVLDELDELRAAIGDSPAFRVTGLAVDDEEPEWVRALFDDGGASLFAECYGADAARLIVAAVNRLPELTAALRAVLAEHLPMQNAPGLPPACPECLGGIHADDPDEPRSCGCWGLSTPVCSSCADSNGGSRRYPMQWPCPTVAAITTALEAS